LDEIEPLTPWFLESVAKIVVFAYYALSIS